jgi:2-polyprenyl-3-methyl-5-hydroxy-6-metoxy-1,4-benzoquinol methylase
MQSLKKNNTMKDFWNERYRAETYAYGETPNQYFKEQLDRLAPGKILLPAEGEGRNAVYAAQMGWEVYAFDQSEAGKHKAQKLAAKHNISILYEVGSVEEIELTPGTYDAVGLIYAHFPSDRLSKFHQRFAQSLKSGGVVILEAFSKAHLAYNSVNPQAGGPKNIDMLFSTEQIRADFPDFEILHLAEEIVDLQEGQYHHGKGSVVRFLGRKR